MFTYSQVFILITVIVSIYLSHSQEDVPILSTPFGDISDPTPWIRRLVTDNRIVNNVNHALRDLVFDPLSIASEYYNKYFGEDIVYGWTDYQCHFSVLKSNNWPFRSVKCHLFAARNDIVFFASAIGSFLLTILYRLRVLQRALWRPMVDNSWGSWYINILINMCAQPPLDCSNVRSTFINTMAVTNRRLPKNHSHPRSALSRTTASQQCELVCNALGRKAYYLQQSKSDQRKGRDGCRTFFWGKDLASEYAPCDPPINSTFCLIDVDYYLDMPYMLSVYPGHYLISSVQPSSTACAEGEYQFTFNSDNEIHYTVSGGAEYRHQIWNYKSDVLIAVHTTLWAMHRATAYNVDRRQIDEHHQLICLTPIFTVLLPIFRMTSYLGGHTLDRLKVVCGDFARMDVVTKKGLMRATSKLGGYAVARIPASVDDALAAVSRMSNVRLTMAEVKTTAGIKTSSEAAPLAEFHRWYSKEATKSNDLVYPVDQSVNRYQYTPEQYNPDAKNGLQPFMSPIIPGCYSPDKCINNEAAGVKNRVTDIACPDLELTPKLKLYMEEFVGFLVPPHEYQTHDPVDLDVVYDRQNRPAQRALLNKAGNVIGDPSTQPISTFPKAEAYSEAKPERLISTIPPVDKMHYSSFIYAFSPALRATKWYAFGKTPLEIAARVAMICMLAIAWILKTDFSKMDGRVSNLFRLLERLAMLAWFKPCYHDRLVELMETQQNKRAFTTFGIEYATKYARLSGSPETADFNSMDNGFTAYAAYRDAGLSPQEAWDSLGLFGGDDGITPDLPSENFVKSASDLGQVLEVEKVKRGESGVQMLSREYGPHVWHGDSNSMCDIKRQLSKFHTTTSLPYDITPLHKLAVKAFSYSLTDGETPIIGDIGKFVIQHCPELVVENEPNLLIRSKVGSYFSQVPKDVQFPNELADWMFAVVDRDIPTFDMEKFEKWLKNCEKDVSLLLAPPLCADILNYQHVVQKEDVVINGDIVESPAKTKPVGVGKPADAPIRSKTPCKHFAATPPRCSWGDRCKFAHVTV